MVMDKYCQIGGRKCIHSSFHLNSSGSDSGLPEELGDGQMESPRVPPVCGAELCPAPGEAGAGWREREGILWAAHCYSGEILV